MAALLQQRLVVSRHYFRHEPFTSECIDIATHRCSDAPHQPRRQAMSKHVLGACVGVMLLAAQAGFAQAPPRAIVVGQTLVQSGPLADLSPGPVSGVRALFQAVNAAGGVHGRPLELRQADDAYDDTKASENVKAFARQGAVAILMPIG